MKQQKFTSWEVALMASEMMIYERWFRVVRMYWEEFGRQDYNTMWEAAYEQAKREEQQKARKTLLGIAFVIYCSLYQLDYWGFL